MTEDKTLITVTKQCPMCQSIYGAGSAVCVNDGTLLMPIRKDTMTGTLFADKYRISGELGRGGMSVLYRGFHELMRRNVAIKVMQNEMSGDPLSVRRFQQESEAASRLSHPHIISVFDFGITPEAQPYMVMDLVDGLTFSEVIKKQGALPQGRVLFIFDQICDALAHAHSEGVVHRDLKPSNVMLTSTDSRQDYVKILDFGIAKVSPKTGEDERGLTTTGEIFGSPLYMSPEQCTSLQSDQRTDVYALGIMLYEALTGRPPICGANSIETLQMQISTIPRSFAKVNPDLNVSPQLEAIVFKAIEKKPEDRFQTMKELQNALRLCEVSSASANAGMGGRQSSIKVSGADLPTLRKNNPRNKIALIGGLAFLLLFLGGCILPGLVARFQSGANNKTAQGPLEHIKGTLAYYNPDANSGFLLLNGPYGAAKIMLGTTRLETLVNQPGAVVANGQNWDIAFHRVNDTPLLDAKGTRMTGSVNEDFIAVDKLVREHYAKIARKDYDGALADFSPLFVQNAKTRGDVIKGMKRMTVVEDCEHAPLSAIQILPSTSFSIATLVDASKFVKGEKSNYKIVWVKSHGSWKLQSLEYVPKDL